MISRRMIRQATDDPHGTASPLRLDELAATADDPALLAALLALHAADVSPVAGVRRDW